VTALAASPWTARPGRAVHPAVTAAFQALDRAGVGWAVLRGVDELADPSGDVDVLVPGSAWRLVRSALSAAGFVELPRPGRGSHRFFVGPDSSGGWIKLDLVDDLAFGRWAEIDTGLAGACLERRGRSADGVCQLSTDDAAWAQLLHLLLDPGRATADRRDRLVAAAAGAGRASASGPVAAWVRDLGGPGPEAIVAAISAAQHGRVDAVRGRVARRLRRAAMRQAPARTMARVIRTVAQRRLAGLPTPDPARRRGLVVALLGPDGTGKSSVAARLAKHAPVPVRRFYLGAYPNADGLAHEHARRVPGPGLLRRLTRLAARGAAARVHAWCGGLAILDRHPLETQLDGRGGLRRRLLARAVPRPNLVLVLDAPAAVIHDRKAEWPLVTVERQLAGYRRLAERPGAIAIDATGSVDEVTVAAIEAIWAHWARRQAPDRPSRPQPSSRVLAR
jgi:thymidylate kinase